jgi:hypothetical protein
MRAAFVQLQIKIQSAAVVEQCWSWCCCTLSWDDVDLKGGGGGDAPARLALA